MEAKLQKLKVTDLKELLSKHGLTQSGKKEELVKRLLDNNVSVEDDGPDTGGAEEELADPDPIERPSAPTPASAAAGPPVPTTEPATAPEAAPAPAPEAPAAEPPILSAEQQALKSRAERFGMPFNSSAAASSPAGPSSAATNGQSSSATPATNAASATKADKPAAIDKTPLGISEDVLAKRAAKFGPVTKAAPPTAAPASTPAPASKTGAAEPTPEQAARIAEEEEKKRKRAEKFGTGKPAVAAKETSNGEPDAKKVKV